MKTTQKTQFELQREIVKSLGINVVTCGDCGSVLLHEVCYEEITCPDCGFTSDPCNFPDLNY